MVLHFLKQNQIGVCNAKNNTRRKEKKVMGYISYERRRPFDELMGKTIIKIETTESSGDIKEVDFFMKDGSQYRLMHYQD